MSFNFSPNITLVAISITGKFVTLLMYGTVLLERGFTSIIYTSLFCNMNWMFIIPITFNSLANSLVYLTIFSSDSLFTFCVGYTDILSPECTPVLSNNSIIPGIKTSSPSQIASTSISFPMIYLSTNIGCSCAILFISCINFSISKSSYAIAIPCPPSTYEGLTSTGYPNLLAISFASVAVYTVPPCGLVILQLFKTWSNNSLSSALSIFSSDVPRILTPISFNALVNLIAVCPPNCTIAPYGFSMFIMFSTSSGVNGSK